MALPTDRYGWRSSLLDCSPTFEALQPMTEASLHGYESALAMERLEQLDNRSGQEKTSLESMNHQSSIDVDKTVSPMIRMQALSFAYDVLPIYEGLELSIHKR